MTSPAADTQIQVKRCAVCKIDRKGRFILADHEAEKLFGLSEVKLFGQPFVDFLVPSDRNAVQQMTEDRNPYETVYDAARLTIVDAHGHTIPAMVILSVNFGGGNPANYQIVIIPEGGESSDRHRRDIWRTLVETLCENDLDPVRLAEILKDATGAAGVDIYRESVTRENRIARAGESITASSDTNSGEGEFNENRGTFALADGSTGVAVLFSGEGIDTDRVELAATLLHQLRHPIDESGQSPDAAITPPDLGVVLSHLGIVSMAIDEFGNVHNVSDNCELLFSGLQHLAGLDQWLKRLAEFGNDDLLGRVDAYFKASRSRNAAPDFLSSFVTDRGQRLELRILRMSDDELHPGWTVLMGPEIGVPVGGFGTCGVSSDLVRVLCRTARESFIAGSNIGRRLEHDYHGLIEEQADFDLACLNEHMESGELFLAELDRVASLTDQPVEIQNVNLSLLIKKTVDSLRESFHGDKLEVTLDDIPSLKADRRRVQMVVEGVLGWWCRRPSHRLEAVARVETSGDRATLHFDFESVDLTKREVRRLLARQAASLVTGSDTKLAIEDNLLFIKEIATQIGGRLEARAIPNHGARISFTFPIA